MHSLVHGKSGGTVGYVHVPDMDEAGFAEFHRLFLLESQREALIVDIRWNEGGLGRCIFCHVDVDLSVFARMACVCRYPP